MAGAANIRQASAQQDAASLRPKAKRGYVIEQVAFQENCSIGLIQSSFKKTKSVVLPFAMKVSSKGDQIGLSGENRDSSRGVLIIPGLPFTG
jgi:hypothetical protein